MKEISKLRFSGEYERLVGRKRIDDHHYYYGHAENHEMVLEKIREYDVWTAIMYGRPIKKVYKELPKLFRRLPVTWEQLFFIDDSETLTIYRGNSSGSGYRFTHGIMANAFALLGRERDITTFVLSQGPRGGLRIHVSDALRVHGHELSGNYRISREELDKTVPKSMRIYGPIR
jgi:hypothetical protein